MTLAQFDNEIVFLYTVVFIRLEHCLEIICYWTHFDERITKLVSIVRAQLKQNATAVSVTAYHSLMYPFTHEERKAIAVVHANEIQKKVTDTTTDISMFAHFD